MVLEVERRDSVAVVTISAEAARNAFDSDSMNEISTTLNGLMDDSDIRGIVLTGTGRFFCAGADIDEFQRSIDDGRIGPLVENLTSILHPLQIRMRTDPTILVAAINGAAAGGAGPLATMTKWRSPRWWVPCPRSEGCAGKAHHHADASGQGGAAARTHRDGGT